MVIKEKWTLEPIYIRNHDKYNVVCEYYPDTGDFREVELSKEIEGKLWRGSYYKVDENIYGVFASAKGPFFFENNKKYLINKYDYKIEVQESKLNYKTFMLSINNVEEIKIDYPVMPAIVDPWADEEMIDFFFYMSKVYSRQGFYENFTLQQS